MLDWYNVYMWTNYKTLANETSNPKSKKPYPPTEPGARRH
jgi:hypothetical protein